MSGTRAAREMEVVLNEYNITSLKDIFNLPTDDAVERCMKELTMLMLTTRNTIKLLDLSAREIAKKDGIELPPGPFHEWPDEVLWRDDNGGTSHVTFQFGDDKGMTMDIKHAKH